MAAFLIPVAKFATSLALSAARKAILPKTQLILGAGLQKFSQILGKGAIEKSINSLGLFGTLSGIKADFIDPLLGSFSEGQVEENQAQASGMNADAFGDWSELAGEIGQSPADVLSMTTSLGSQLGSAALSGGASPEFSQALGTLGLGYEQLAQLSPEQQLLSVMHAASQQPDSNQALAAVNQILGAEGAQLFSHINQSEEPVLADTFGGRAIRALPEPSPLNTLGQSLSNDQEQMPAQQNQALNSTTADFNALAESLPPVVSGFDQLGQWFSDSMPGGSSTGQMCTSPMLTSLLNEESGRFSVPDSLMQQATATVPPLLPPGQGEGASSTGQSVQIASMPVTINIYQQPGESGQALATEVVDALNRVSSDSYAAAGN